MELSNNCSLFASSRCSYKRVKKVSHGGCTASLRKELFGREYHKVDTWASSSPPARTSPGISLMVWWVLQPLGSSPFIHSRSSSTCAEGEPLGASQLFITVNKHQLFFRLFVLEGNPPIICNHIFNSLKWSFYRRTYMMVWEEAISQYLGKSMLSYQRSNQDTFILFGRIPV